MPILEDPEGHEPAALRSASVSFAARRVLEIGCGDGRLTRRIANDAASVIAIDPDAGAISRLSAALPGIDARALAVDRLQLPRHSVDAVLFSWSL